MEEEIESLCIANSPCREESPFSITMEVRSSGH